MNGHATKRTSKKKGDRWRALVFVDAAHGGPRTEVHGTFDLKREAEAKITKVLDAYLAGAYRKPSKLTVRAVVDRWLTEHVAQLRPLSRQNYEQICARFILPAFGDELAEAVTPADVSAWLARLLKNGRRDSAGGMAPKYVRQVRFIFRSAYSWSVKHGEIAKNPIDAVPGPAVARRNVDPPTVKAMQAARVGLSGTRYLVPMCLAAGTGMRRGEALGLSWAHVDLTAGIVRVRRQLIEIAGGVSFALLKTNKARRDLYLPPFAVSVLEDERARQQAKAQVAGMAWSADALVCPNHDGGPIPPDKFSRGFTSMLQRRGITPFRFHDLRHAFATELLEAGERADVVADLLGHASVAITLGIYAHVRPGEGEKAAARYGQKWQPQTPDPEPEIDAESENGDHSETKSARVLDLGEARRQRRPA